MIDYPRILDAQRSGHRAKEYTQSKCVLILGSDPFSFPFARWNPRLKRSPTPTSFAEIVSDDFPVLHRPLTDDSTPFAARLYSLQAVPSPSVDLHSKHQFALADAQWSCPAP